MPTVPAYSLPQEQERALPGARVESVASPALLDAGAEQTIKAGGALMGAGSVGNAIMFQMQQRENADAIFRVEAEDKAAWINYEADIKKTRQGQYAKNATVDTATWWKDRISKNIGTLGNTEAQRAYSQRATELQLQALHGVSNFEGQQLEIAHDQSWKADKVNTINMAASNPTPLTVDSSMKEIKRFNAYQAARKGWKAEVLNAENDADITNLHTQVIQQLAATNKDQAAAYFELHKDEINGSQRAEIGEFAMKATAVAMGSKAAQAEWLANGPKSDTDAADIDVMAANIRDQFKDNTFTRDAALTELKQMKTERDAGIQSRDAKRTATVNEMLMQGKSLAAVQQTPAWLALDGTERRKIVLHEESIANQRESRAAARESRAASAAVRAEHQLSIAGWETMERLSEPTALMAIKDRNQVLNLRPVIGQENTQRLLAKWDQFSQNTAKLSDAKIDNDKFKEFASDAGLDPAATYGKNKDMALRVSALRDKVESVIGQEQIAKRRDLTREEKDSIMRREIDNQVIQHSTFWFDKSVPAMALPGDKKTLANAYVVVNGNEVKLSSIPPADRVQIIRARKNAGLPVTEQAIAEMWVKKNAKAAQ